MKQTPFRKLVLVSLLVLVLQPWEAPGVSGRTEEAYVTLLYGDEFLLGARVLGKSIRDTGSTKDMVVLVSDGVSEYAKKLLQADGWLVQHISLLENPNQVRPSRFWGVYTKLKIFNMVKYKKVVYLDADTVVVRSIEDLFKCGKFCANLKHSERLNSGVIVLEPSAELFNDMMSKVKTTFSYTGGDQGFLNSYFVGFANARIFEPNSSRDKSRTTPVMERLSTLYNADVGLYMLANKWMVDERELRIIHYTLGPLKPWDWWTSWLVKPVDVWQNVRAQLAETLPGTRGGRNRKDDLFVKFLFLFPILALFLCFYRLLFQTREFFATFNGSSLCDHGRHLFYKIRSGGALSYLSVASSSANNSNQLSAQSKVPEYLGGVSVLICFAAAVVSVGVAFMVVPRQVTPWTGLLLLYEWTFTIFFMLFGGYLYLIHRWGMAVATQGSFPSPSKPFDYDSGKGHQQQVSSCNCTSGFYWFGMACLAIATPSLPFLFGVTALFLRFGLMAVGGLVLACFMTYASEHLSVGSFTKGIDHHHHHHLLHRDGVRARSTGSFC